MKKLHYGVVTDSEHQADYDKLFHAAFNENGFSPVTTRIGLPVLLSSTPLFFSSMDRGFALLFKVLSVCFVRSLMNRKTGSILFRPKACFHTNNPLYILKRWVLALIRNMPGVTIFSIVPYPVYPHAAKVSSTWIYDPQLWDLHYLGAPGADVPQPFEAELLAAAKGRKIVATLGRQDESKGFAAFVDLWCASPALREKFLFVAAGKIAPACQDKAKAFESAGGFLLARRIEDAELMRFYTLADMIWSCYAPAYDQSSGIFGRAVQFGIPAIVRATSALQELSALVAHPSLAIPFTNPAQAAQALLAWNAAKRTPEETQQTVESIRRQALEGLRALTGQP